MRLPTGHQTLSMVKRFPEANGRNSRKSAPSTGRFPPTPRPKQANKAQVLFEHIRIPSCQNGKAVHLRLYVYVPNPIRATTGSQTEYTGDKKGQVECRTTSDHIGCNTPERSTQAKTQEERAGGKTNSVFRNAEFHRQLRQSKSNALNMSVRHMCRACFLESRTCNQRLEIER